MDREYRPGYGRLMAGTAERRTPLRAPSCERDGWKRLAHTVTYPVPLHRFDLG